MYNELQTYENSLTYEYVRNNECVYGECIDTGAVIKVYYDKFARFNGTPWLSSFDNTHYATYKQAFDAYEQALYAAYEKDARAYNERGGIIS